MTRVFDTAAELQAAIGQPFGPSEPITVDQDSIDRFAEATHDHQWIHTDVERAARETGGTIAHGMLTLSLVVPLVTRLFRVAVPASINYGFDRVRFLAPVPVGSQVRASATISDVQVKAEGTKIRSSVELTDTEGATYCVAEWITFYPGLAEGRETDA